MRKMLSRSLSSYRLVIHKRSLILTCLTVLFLFFIACVPYLRNKLLSPVWPYAWREMGTLDVISLRFFTQNIIDVEGVKSCPQITTPTVKLSDLDTTKIKVYQNLPTVQLHSFKHQRFLFTMAVEDKIKLLYIYTVLEEALRNMRVEFFFVSGSLLGVHRHHGIIPWDDDLDIAINKTDWKLVRHGLSCIEGFVLSVTNFMHWKFYPNSSQPGLAYPFVDIFFYTENERFIWAVSKSSSLNIVLNKKDTFPLTTGQFEGLAVPIPKNTDHVLRVGFDFDICESRAMDHKRVIVMPKSERIRVPCSSLTYLYDMYNLDST